MCRRSDALDQLTQAARCLTDACETRMGTAGALQEIYRSIAQEPVPAAIERLLATLGGKDG